MCCGKQTRRCSHERHEGSKSNRVPDKSCITSIESTDSKLKMLSAGARGRTHHSALCRGVVVTRVAMDQGAGTGVMCAAASYDDARQRDSTKERLALP
jgi:hypothetical protein